MITFENVEEFLDNASADELERLRVRTEQLLWYEKKGMRVPGKGKGENGAYRGAQELSEDGIILYGEIAQAFKDRTGENRKLPLSSFRERYTTCYRKYVKTNKSTLEFLHGAVGNVTDAEKHYLYYLAASTLITLLERMNVPISIYTIVMNMDKIPYAMARAFPGYAQAGILKLVLAKNRPKQA